MVKGKIFLGDEEVLRLSAWDAESLVAEAARWLKAKGCKFLGEKPSRNAHTVYQFTKGYTLVIFR